MKKYLIIAAIALAGCRRCHYMGATFPDKSVNRGKGQIQNQHGNVIAGRFPVQNKR